MVKDPAIEQLLERCALAEHGWVTVDHWDADLCAIGIGATSRPGLVAYVSTFQMPPGRYFCEVEASRDGEPECIERHEDHGFSELMSVLSRWLG